MRFIHKNYFSWINSNVFGFGLASFFGDTGYEITTVLLPMFVQNLIGSKDAPLAVGFITGVADAIASCIKPFSGWLGDRFPKKPIIIFGYAITGFFSALIGIATSITSITLLRTVAWFGKGVREPARDALLSQSITSSLYGRAFGLNRALDTAGALFGPLLALLLINFISLHTIFLLTMVPGFFAVLMIVIFVKEKLTTKQTEHAYNFFNSITALPSQFYYFVIVMFIFGCGNFSRTLLVLYTHNYAPNSFSIPILLYSLFNVIRAVSEYYSGWLSDFYRRKLLLQSGFFFFGCTSLMLLYHSTSLWFLTIIFILTGISTGIVSPLERARAAELLPEEVRSTGFGVLQFIDGVGDFVSSFIVGLLWTYYSMAAGFLYAAILSGISVIALGFQKDYFK